MSLYKYAYRKTNEEAFLSCLLVMYQRTQQCSLFRDGQGNFEFTRYVKQDDSQGSYIKHTDTVILPSSSPNYSPRPQVLHEWDGSEHGQCHFPLFLCFFQRWGMTGQAIPISLFTTLCMHMRSKGQSDCSAGLSVSMSVDTKKSILSESGMLAAFSCNV